MTLAELADALDAARRATFDVARHHLRQATSSFDSGDFALSCFMAMTCIEEAGKSSILDFGRVAMGVAMSGGDPQAEASTTAKPGTRKLQYLLRNHTEKARQAATAALYVNAGADGRHGTHPVSGIHRTGGVVLLARSRQWMAIRNACLYVDFDLDSGCVKTPSTEITPALAHYMVTMAHEVVAECAYHGVGPIETSAKEWDEVYEVEEATLRDLDEFVRSTLDVGAEVDLLWFLADPAPLRKEADLRDLETDASRERETRSGRMSRGDQ